MFGFVVHLVIFLVLVVSSDCFARRSYITPEQKTQLSRVQTILVSALALGEKGLASPDPIFDVVKHRLEELGFRVVRDPAQFHDVEVQVMCEERKREQAVARYGGDAELTGTPERLWHGPACQISYRLEGRNLGWSQEVHASIGDVQEMTGESRFSDAENAFLSDLTRELENLDFPVMLLSEWGQTHRLIALLTSPETTQARQLLILDVLREYPSFDALPHLLQMIQKERYAEEAIGALSGLGGEVVPHLVKLFENKEKELPVRAAAAKGLGRILRADGDPQVMEILLDYLSKALARIHSSTDIEFPVLTEVVWAVGSIHHRPTFQLVVNLQNRIWMIYDTSPEMKKLRDMVSVVHRFMEFNQL